MSQSLHILRIWETANAHTQCSCWLFTSWGCVLIITWSSWTTITWCHKITHNIEKQLSRIAHPLSQKVYGVTWKWANENEIWMEILIWLAISSNPKLFFMTTDVQTATDGCLLTTIELQMMYLNTIRWHNLEISDKQSNKYLQVKIHPLDTLARLINLILYRASFRMFCWLSHK